MSLFRSKPLLASGKSQKGQLNPAAYPRFALTFAILMVVTIWYSAIGTHHCIPFLPQPSKDTPRLSLNRFFAEMVNTFKVRPFRFMASGMVFWYVIYGLYQGMTLYLCTYFWGFSSKQIAIILPISMLGTFSVLFARKVARIVGEKRDTWIYASIWSAVAGGIPLFLRLFHLLPGNDHPIIFPLVAASFFLCQMGFAITLAMGHSILADITDEHERVHHVRQEVLYYGAISLMQKIATGLGSFVTGLIVDFSGIGSLKDPSTISWETLARFGWCFIAVPTVVNVIAILFVRHYDISRARHAEILEELANRRTGSAAVPS